MSFSRDMSVARAIAWRSIHNLLRNPAFLIPSIIFPLFFFTAFAGGLSRIGDQPDFGFASGYTAFQYVFVMIQSAAFGGVFTGFAAAADWENGFAQRLMLGAPNRLAIIAGYAMTALLRWGIVAVVLTIVALLTGMNIDGSAADLASLFALALLVNIAASLFALGMAARFQSIQIAPAIQIPTFLTLFLAPVYVPADLLSGWVKSAASVNPVTAFLEAGRGFISGQPEHVGIAFAAVAGLVAFFMLFARRGMRRAEAPA
jgi:ABC-2 type transport system permease protein